MQLYLATLQCDKISTRCDAMRPITYTDVETIAQPEPEVPTRPKVSSKGCGHCGGRAVVTGKDEYGVYLYCRNCGWEAYPAEDQ